MTDHIGLKYGGHVEYTTALTSLVTVCSHQSVITLVVAMVIRYLITFCYDIVQCQCCHLLNALTLLHILLRQN